MKVVKYILSFLILLILQIFNLNSFAYAYSYKELGVLCVENSEQSNSDFSEPCFKENNIPEPSFYEFTTHLSVSYFRVYAELVESWKVLDDVGIPSVVKGNPRNLEVINNLGNRVNKTNLSDALKNTSDPQKLIDDLGKADNFYSGRNGIEISIDASTDKVIISRKTLDADVQDIASLRTKYTAGKKKNIATGKGEIGGKKIDLESVSGEVTPENYAQKGNFQPPKENHYQGRLGYENHTEQKIVEYLRNRFKNDFNVKGTIEIASERPYCRNCIDIVDQFQAEFKNITVIRVEVLPKF